MFVPSHRARNPVVSVYLKSQSQRIYSVCVPPSKEWDEFLASVRSKFDLDETTPINIFHEITNEETIEDDFALNEVNFKQHPTMEFIRHGATFCVSVDEDAALQSRSSESDASSDQSSSESDEAAEDEETNFNFDLFGRFDVTRSKSKPLGYTAAQRSYQEIWKQIRHSTAVCQHIDTSWTEFTVTLGESNDEEKQAASQSPVQYRFRLHRMIVPFGVQSYATGESFTYGVENMIAWRWCIILCHGGRFSCGIFEGDRAIQHRSVSRYVRRAKQGKRQMNHLSHGNKSNTAGGQKRESNEKKLHEDIIRTLQEWQQEISSCDVILLHAPGPVNERSIFGTSRQQAALYGGRGVSDDSIRERLDECWKNRHKMGFRLNRDDVRLKRITITTHRAKFSEVNRVHRYYSKCAVVPVANDSVAS